jgi:ubiquinone/menaquinone biosynthesis C-methylase UbiE
MNDYFDIRYTIDPDRARIWKAIVEDLQKYIKKDYTVVDLGSGYCDFINQVRCKKKYAVDYSARSREYCGKDVHFVQATSTDLSIIHDQSVDVVFSSNLFEHLNRDQLDLTIREIRRILKSGSLLILLQPNYRYCYREYFDDFTHVSIFTHINLRDWLVRNYFKPVKLTPRYLPLAMKSLLPKSYWLTKLYLLSPWKPMGKQMLLVFEKTEEPIHVEQ